VAVERIGPAVVNISAERIVRPRPDPLEQFFSFGFPGRRQRGFKTESLGSGVVIGPAGVVVVTRHAPARHAPSRPPPTGGSSRPVEGPPRTTSPS
jgi:S1-C subfamily serine protease